MKPAFSTVALPDWTLRTIGERLEHWGYLGCELRTFGHGSAQFACDPALTDTRKVRSIFDKAGVAVCSLGTGVRFDEPINPPVIGRVISDTERSVREAQGMIQLAVALEAPLVRVFAYELPAGEGRASGVARIVERLRKAVDTCRNSGVQLMLENGGSFPRAADLTDIIDRVGSPLLRAALSLPVAVRSGDEVASAVSMLGDRLVCVKVKDMRGGTPVALGEGEFNVRAQVETLARAGFAGWIVYEHDRAWLAPGDQTSADDVLTRSSRALYTWLGRSASAMPSTTRVRAR